MITKISFFTFNWLQAKHNIFINILWWIFFLSLPTIARFARSNWDLNVFAKALKMMTLMLIISLNSPTFQVRVNEESLLLNNNAAGLSDSDDDDNILL
jgi:hypothetical protein